MKLNKKGFMLAEVVVVSVVIATALVTLFIALNRLISAFETRNRYHDIDAAYLAVEVNDILVENGIINTLILNQEIKDVSSDTSDEYSNVSEFINFYSGNKKVYFSPYSNDKINLIKDESVNKTFKDYIDYLNDNLDYDDEDTYMYVIISEICDDTNNNCLYYALKVR